VTLVDEDWELLTSGWLDTDANGYLQPVTVEFPEGSGLNWELCAVEASTDLSQANVTLTFEDRIVASLRKFFGPKKATRGPSMTRAEFIRSLTKDVAGDQVPVPGAARAAAGAGRSVAGWRGCAGGGEFGCDRDRGGGDQPGGDEPGQGKRASTRSRA
jgi:hypothetical protein